MALAKKRYKSWAFITLLILSIMVFYFIFNPSYEKSLQAKMYYSLGNYDKAYSLSSQAYKIEPYNRMAQSVMVQSQYALRYVKYNQEAQKYLTIIKSYANQKKISIAEQMRIKMMCDIMIGEFEKMQPTILIDKELVQKSKRYYEEFVKLHEQIIQAI